MDTFVDKNVLKYRFCGLLLSTWDNLCGQVLFLNLLIVPVLAVFGAFYKCGQDKILFAGAVGILSAAVLILVDKSINLSSKKKMLRLNLLDYLENFCKVRLEQEVVSPELTSQLRREFVQISEAGKQISAAKAPEKEATKDELSRRREARLKKEEERKAVAVKREEEQRRAEEARKEEERRKLEEKKQAAVRRREEERVKVEEEKVALEAKREEMKRKAQEKQLNLETKKQKVEEKEQILHSIEQDLKTSADRTDMDILMQGLEEIAADQEKAAGLKEENERKDNGKADAKQKKTTSSKVKSQAVTQQEERLIEDVLKEFFA